MDKVLKTIIKIANQPFNYGNLDCAIFAGKVVQDLYGINLVTKYINKYSNIEEAKEYLSNNNYSNLIEAVSCELNQKPITPKYLSDGDLVAIKSKFKGLGALGYALGIVYKNYGFFVREKGNTVGKVSLEKCECGWHINV